MTQNPNAQAEVAGSRQPTSVWRMLRNIGPGMVVAMMWLGTGDLVSSSVSGGNYGYAFMWAIIVAVVARFFVTSLLAKYQLCNAMGDRTILHGYGRIWRGFPLFLAGAGVLLAFGYNTSLLLGSALALYHLTGEFGGDWGVFSWAALICIFTVFMATRRGQFKTLEWFAIASVIVLVGTFLVALAFTGIKPFEAARGLAFGIPADSGPIAAILLVVALIGGVGGSANNLLYTYFMDEKGWRGPQFRRQQIYDLLAGIVAIIVIDIAIWMVAAQALQDTALVIKDVTDLETMMVSVIGPAGAILLWIGLLGAAYDGYPALALGYSKMFVGAVHQTFPQRAERFSAEERDPLDEDPIRRWVQIPILLILPLIFSLPFSPGFIFLTVIANALAVVLVPGIIVGLFWMTNKRQWLLPGWANSWWENVIMVIIGAIGLWATYELVRNLLNF